MKDTSAPAVLITSALGSTKSGCKMLFRYRNYVPTNYIGTFNITVVHQQGTTGNLLNERQVLHIHELTGNQWVTQLANLGELADGSQIRLSGYTVTFQNDPPYGDIEIDEIKFYDC
ncbi:uncharacterized protein LOC128951352 [Oppia nitens]|uniref:uncharacterized protein LOC128951352 n=1 Tax=Oppia nitens TaxID=1686743 RepID=UPI0023DB1DDF|nr:uncharacterized protein LOC128951352 [Oppia nitens]